MITINSNDLQSLVKELSDYHIKLIAYAKKADRELKHNIARLFKALSFSKEVQALFVLHFTGCVKNTISNIEECLDGADNNTTRKDELSYEGVELIDKFKEIEEKNRHLYSCAKDTLESQKDLNIGAINVCSKCGYTLIGDAPKECIICHAPSGYFRVFSN